MTLRNQMNITLTDSKCIKLFDEQVKDGGFDTRDYQYNFMLEQGLKPDHYFLDVGCGWLRAGLLFMGYLKNGHYFGIDQYQEWLNAGYGGILKYGLQDKEPSFKVNGDFEVSKWGVQFDYALAYSVLTHLVPWDFVKCVHNVMAFMKKNGKFYATFFESPKHLMAIGIHPNRQCEFKNVLYPFDWIERNVNYKVEYIGNGIKPFKQKTLVFTK